MPEGALCTASRSARSPRCQETGPLARVRSREDGRGLRGSLPDPIGRSPQCRSDGRPGRDADPDAQRGPTLGDPTRLNVLRLDEILALAGRLRFAGRHGGQTFEAGLPRAVSLDGRIFPYGSGAPWTGRRSIVRSLATSESNSGTDRGRRR